MNEQELYAKIGKLQTLNDTMKENYSKLIRVVSEIVSGECDVSRVLVNLTDETVSWAPQGERPSMPATINGKPECVIAPEKPQPEIPPTDQPN